MTKSAAASAGLLGFALSAFFLHHLSLSGTSQNSRAETTLFAQIGSPAETGTDASSGSPPVKDATDSQPGSAKAPQLGDRSPIKAEVDARRSLTTRPTSRVAAAALQALDQEVQMPPSVPLGALPTLIQQSVSVPVMIDPRALEFADVSPDASLDFTQAQWPLRSALRGALRPLGLRAIVDDEGIVITADPAVLVHRGIGVSRWINVDEEAEQVIASKLATRVSYSFVEETLENALRIIAEDQDLPILLDRKSLDDTPYTPDTPVNLTLRAVTLRTFLDLMLRDFELTCTIQGEILGITTPETAELFPLTRIYWLEGTGLTGGSGVQLTDTIESIEPDAWETAGGTASIRFISRGHDNRPAIIVSATYLIHHQLENLLAATRASHFGPDLEFIPADELPAAPAMGPFCGGGTSVGGIGMGGMGGMGMGAGGK